MDFTRVGEVLLAHRVSGAVESGRWVVLLHSLGTEGRIWDAVAAELATTCAVLTYDLRGHGLSGATEAPYGIETHAADLVGLMDALGIEQASLVGVSVGAQIALAVAAQHPHRASSLVLCNTGLRIGTREGWDARIAAVEVDGLASVAPAVVDGWFVAVSEEQRLGYRQMLCRTSVQGYVGTAAAVRDADLSGLAGQVRAPTLCLSSERDEATPPPCVEAVAAAIPGAELVALPATAHLPVVERPERFAAEVLGFLARLDGEDRHAIGMRVRRRVLGDAHVDNAQRQSTDFDADFQRFITEGAWGSLWSRPGLSPRVRSLITIAILAALNHQEEVEMHVRATANTGATPGEVREALLHVATYAGVAAGNAAFRSAGAAYGEPRS